MVTKIQFLNDRPPSDNILTAVTLPVRAHSSAFIEHNSCSMYSSSRCPRLRSLSLSAAKGFWHLHPTQLYISRTVNNPAKMCTELKIGGYWWLFYGSLSLSCASHHSHCAPTQHNLHKAFHGLSGIQQMRTAFRADTQTAIICRENRFLFIMLCGINWGQLKCFYVNFTKNGL